MNKDMYREMVKPYQEEYFDSIKSMTDAKLMYHSDGNIVDFLDDLVEIGVDILNPVETSALVLDRLKDFEPSARYPARIAIEIEDRAGLEDVDVRILNDKSPRFLQNVLKDSKLIFCEDGEHRVDFESSSLVRYLDMKPFFEEEVTDFEGEKNRKIPVLESQKTT